MGGNWSDTDGSLGRPDGANGLLDFLEFLKAIQEKAKTIECWRDVDWTSRNALLKATRDFSTGMESVPQVNLLLVGNVGAGKSSVINTIDSAFKGRIALPAEARTTGSSTSVTKQYRIYKPGGRRGQPVAFNFCDTMGMELDKGLAVEDMVYVMDGNLPNGFRFRSSRRITPDDPGFIRWPEVSQRIHCVAIVVDGAKASSLSETDVHKLKQIKSLARSRGMTPVILITHIDEVCPAVQRDIQNTYSSFAVHRVMRLVSELSGVAQSEIFPLKNYCDELTLDSNIDIIALTALKKMLDCADAMLNKFRSR